MTVNVPSIPAWRCPGTEQKNLYVPGLRLSVNAFEPPLNVGVSPSFWPDDDSTVTLCISDAMFVKSIETLPAFAVSDFVLYSSWPSRFASRLTLLEAPDELVPPLAGVVDVAELVVSAGVLVEPVVGVVVALLDEELPQPASTTSAATSATAEINSALRLPNDCPAESSLTSPPLVGVVALTTPPGADPSPVARPAAASPLERAYAVLALRLPAMQLDDAIRTRRTHKAFGADAVPAATLDELFELARWAPNHHLTNPWRFRVIGERARARLLELADSTQPGSAVKLQRAPTLVAASAQLSGDPAQDREDLYATALAAYVVLLGAHARGLAGYWRTVPLLDDARGREILGLAASEQPVGLLYLGTPVQEQRVPERAAPDEYVSYLD